MSVAYRSLFSSFEQTFFAASDHFLSTLLLAMKDEVFLPGREFGKHFSTWGSRQDRLPRRIVLLSWTVNRRPTPSLFSTVLSGCGRSFVATMKRIRGSGVYTSGI